MTREDPGPGPDEATAGAADLRHEYAAAGVDLAKRVAALPEPAMRAAALVEFLTSVDIISGVWALEAVIRGALRKDPACLSIYESLLDPGPVAKGLGAQRLQDMLAAGSEAGCVAAGQWLNGQLTPLEPKETFDPDRLVAWGLREMTLGDRRALARRARGDTIDQLAVDPDPGVINNLLNNRRVTERVVLAICSRRPTVSPALVAVVRAPRWIQRYPIKLALVRNPYLDLKFGLNLLVYLTRQDLEQIHDDATLAPRLRLGAQRLLDLLVFDSKPLTMRH